MGSVSIGDKDQRTHRKVSKLVVNKKFEKSTQSVITSVTPMSSLVSLFSGTGALRL